MEATGWLKMRAGVGKGAGAETVTCGRGLSGREENRGNLGIAIPGRPISLFKSQAV